MLSRATRILANTGTKIATKPKVGMQWPYIDRPSLSSAVLSALSTQSPNEVTWLVGGLGCGKTECVHRIMTKLMRSRKKEVLGLILDFSEFETTELGSESGLARILCRSIALQISQQVFDDELWGAIQVTIPDFEKTLLDFVSEKPMKRLKYSRELWSQLCKSEPHVFSKIRLDPDPKTELDKQIALLQGLPRRTVAVALLHVECVSTEGFVLNVLKKMSSFNCLVECNDAIRNIWNICENEGNIIEITDLPKEAVSAVFVPRLLSDEVHVEALVEICGGRVGLLEKMHAPLTVLIQEQKIKDAMMENEFKTGKELRPSTESRELQIDPLIHKREVLLRDCMQDIYKEHTQRFASEMEHLLDNAERHLLFVETIRLINHKMKSKGYLTLPAGMSPLQIAHPVVLSLLKANLLRISWLPFPRIVPESPMTSLLLEAWITTQTETFSLSDRIKYNLMLINNKVHIEKQLDKLVRK